MTGTKSKFRSKFLFWLDSWPATGRNWRTPYTRIGFDVTLIHSTNNSSSSDSEAAQYNETDLRLRDGEKMKFARGTDGLEVPTRLQ
jgi:hypothetical protein